MKKIIVVILVICITVIGGICIKNYYQHYCAKKIIRSVERSASITEFEDVVSKHKSGINSTYYIINIAAITETCNYTPLQYACSKSDYDKIKILLRYGADPNILDDVFGRSPLLFNLYSGVDSRFEVANLLLDNGANPNIIDNRNNTALYECLIITRCGDTEYQKKESLKLLKRLLSKADSLSDPGGNSTLIGYAAAFGNIDAMKYLLDKNYCEVNETSQTGKTALMDSVSANDNPSICLFLIKQGADKSMMDIDGNSAYDYAVQYDRKKCAMVLK